MQSTRTTTPRTLTQVAHALLSNAREPQTRGQTRSPQSSGRRRRFMPQYTEPPEHMTPFAQVLVDYMWNKRPRNSPPLSYSQLAIRLGVPKQSVSNWILRGSVPPLDTIMIILAKLRIPMRDLYNAYVQSELPVPAWDADDLARITAVEDARREDGATPTDEPATPRIRKPAKAPLALVHEQPEQPEQPQQAPSEWERIVAQTTEALRGVGANQATIDAAIEHLRAQQQPITQRELTLAAEQTADNENEDEHEPPDRASTSKRQQAQAHKAPTTQR